MRLIDADALGELLIYANVGRRSLEEFLRVLKEAPTIEAVPVVHGEWIKETVLSKCSVCGFRLGADTYRCCPNCGAKMDGKAAAE